MAFLPPEEQNNQAPQGQTSPNPMGMAPPPSAGGSSGAGTTAPKAGAAPSSGTPNQFGSSASKLGDYLSANAPQIQGQAQNVAGSLNNAYQQVGTDINNTGSQFGQQVQQGYTAGNQDLVNQAAGNTQQFVKDPNNVSGFQAQYNDAYTGPQSIESTTPYTNTQNEVNTAIQNAGGFNTQGGLQNYFAQQGGNQTQGTNTLDALLTQGNPEAKQTVGNAVNQFGNLTGQLSNTAATADQGVTAAQQAAQGAQQYAQNAINGQNGTLTNLNNQVNTGYQNALQNALSTNANVNSQLGNLETSSVNPYLGQEYSVGNLDPSTLSALGMSQAQWAPLQTELALAGTPQYMTGHNFGDASQASKIDLSQYLQQSDPNASLTKGNTATADQYAQAQALQQLIGGLPAGSLDPTQAAQAGTAPTNFNQFDYGAALQNATNTQLGARGDAQALANQQTAAADAAHNASKSHTLGSNLLNKVIKPAGTFLANPIAAIPNEVNATKTGLKKV